MSRRLRCEGAGASRHGAHALKRPSGGTDGCASAHNDNRQYTHSPGQRSLGSFSIPAHSSRLLSREEYRRFLQHLSLLPENTVLFAQPFVLAQKLGILSWHLGFLGKSPNPPAKGRMPNPQIRRNLRPCQATGERNANRIPLELVAVYRCHIVGHMVRPLMATIALQKPEQTGAGPVVRSAGRSSCPRRGPSSRPRSHPGGVLPRWPRLRNWGGCGRRIPAACRLSMRMPLMASSQL